jgi:hypothetical protein
MDSAPRSSDDGPAPLRRLTGFAVPGLASAAGRKGHALGLTRQWSRQEAAQQAHEGGRASVAVRRAKFGTAQPGMAR